MTVREATTDADLEAHAFLLGLGGGDLFLEEDDSAALAVALGFREVDRQVERVRTLSGVTGAAAAWRPRSSSELAWAVGHGIRLVSTGTQRGNGGMRAVNERLGYVYGTTSRTVWRQIGP